VEKRWIQNTQLTLMERKFLNKFPGVEEPIGQSRTKMRDTFCDQTEAVRAQRQQVLATAYALWWLLVISILYSRPKCAFLV
jgi:hypothetical protein